MPHVGTPGRPDGERDTRLACGVMETCTTPRALVTLCSTPTPTPYRCWNSLNSHAFGPLDTDKYARHIPVGRVWAERTSRAPLTETDLGNMYAGSFNFVPGPCAYGGERALWSPDQ